MTNTGTTELQAFSSIGIDIGKDVLHLVGFDRSGQIVLRRKIKRLALVSTFENLSCKFACNNDPLRGGFRFQI